MAASLTSPVVGSFLGLSYGAWGLAGITAKRPLNRAVVLPGVAALLAGLAIAVPSFVFPSAGYFPFLGGDLTAILLICALLVAPFPGMPRPVRLAALIYGAVSVVLFVARTQMGDNAARYAAYIGVPLALSYLVVPSGEQRGPARWPRLPRLPRLRLPGHWPIPQSASAGAAAVVAVLMVAWAWGPIVEAFSAEAHGSASTPAYYQPLLAKLTVLSQGRPLRVEVPPTLHHWESAYVAPKFPLARGWERQLDVAYDPIFYIPGALTARSYRSWLLANGVSYVALPDTALDYAATAEAALLRSGRVTGLLPVWQDGDWRLWRVEGTSGLASPPAQVLALRPDRAVVSFTHPGRAQLKLRWSQHWSLPTGAVGTACLAPAPGKWTWLSTSRSGLLTLTISVGNGDHGRCPGQVALPSASRGT